MGVAEGLRREHEVVEGLGVDGSEPGSLDWFLGMLQAAMTEVMASEGTALQKANAVARLGNLYLKACGAKELRAANRELARRVAELEKRLVDAEGRLHSPADPDGSSQEPSPDSLLFLLAAPEEPRAAALLTSEEEGDGSAAPFRSNGPRARPRPGPQNAATQFGGTGAPPACSRSNRPW